MPVPLRVVVAGADGAAALARTLRDAGMEVVLAGEGCRADQLVAVVVQEDADALALVGPDRSTGEPLADRASTEALLAERGIDDVAVIGCGADDLGTIAARLAERAARA